MSRQSGIDVSVFQGTVDWERVKAAGVQFAIIRCGYGSDIPSQDDSTFRRNADECTRLGIPFGVYLYSYAETEEKAASEAAHVLRLIKGYRLQYPVFYDLEDSDTTGTCSAEMIGRIADKFCGVIRAAGYYPAIYSNLDWFETVLTDAVFDGLDRWIAQYDSALTFQGEYTMWQYTSRGSVDGIEGNVDMDYCYVDYPAKISGGEPPEENNDIIYVIKSGDTLSEIAERYHMDYKLLAAYNNISDPNRIYAGESLRIPSDGSVQKPDNPFLVKVTADALNIRAGAGTSYKVTGVIRDKGVYTILERREAGGYTWGRLKSGAGWIALYYTKRL